MNDLSVNPSRDETRVQLIKLLASEISRDLLAAQVTIKTDSILFGDLFALTSLATFW